MPEPALKLSLEQARLAALAAQWLTAAAPPPSPAAVLERHGFARTLGGADVYLALCARRPEMRRRDLDGAVERREVQVLPAVRGCMYLVSRRHAALCLRVADLLSRGRAEKEQQKAGLSPGELEAVGRAVLATLAERGPLTPDALRKALPPGTLRSLGEAGKKVGLTSALPSALRRLEFDGQVERSLEGGRLDSERYAWRLAAASPFDGAVLPSEPAALYAELAELFFGGAGFARLGDFASWVGISQRDAKAALERLETLSVAIAGESEPRWALASNRELLADPPPSAVAFLPFEDSLIATQGGPALLVDAAHHGIVGPAWGTSKPTSLGEARFLMLRPLVAEGKVAGFWELDPERAAVCWASFEPLGGEARAQVEELGRRTARFLLEELGHGRSFNLDTDRDLAERSAYLRSLPHGGICPP